MLRNVLPNILFSILHDVLHVQFRLKDMGDIHCMPYIVCANTSCNIVCTVQCIEQWIIAAILNNENAR